MTMDTTTISRAGPADLDALALLFDGYRQFYGQPTDLPRARQWLRERLRFGESVVLVARRGGGAAMPEATTNASQRPDMPRTSYVFTSAAFLSSSAPTATLTCSSNGRNYWCAEQKA